jgi:hypothetical protein
LGWLRLDDGFTQHPKILALGGPAQRWVWLEILEYCARYKTRGKVPRNIADAVPRATRALLARAVEVGLLTETTQDKSCAFLVHDWAKYNPPDPTGAERVARHRARKQAESGESGNAPVTPSNENVTPDITDLTRGQARADPSRPVKDSLSDVSVEVEEGAELEKRERVRLEKWREYAEGRADIFNVEAYVNKSFASGAWPPSLEQEPKKGDPEVAARNWIAGVGWDETFREDMVSEEFDRIERSLGPLALEVRAALLEQWAEEYAQRYPEVVT